MMLIARFPFDVYAAMGADPVQKSTNIDFNVELDAIVRAQLDIKAVHLRQKVKQFIKN